MESGAGKHWTEEEVKALLTVWSEKNIRKQLYRTLRNKGIFIHIAKRLQEKGIFRDWKQCRSKYKNLKYEYRTVKHAHNSGDGSKTMKFFCELDAILQYEPVSQLTEDEDSRDLASETQLVTSSASENIKGKPTSILDSNNPTLIPSVANEGGKHWTINEVKALIDIWSDKNIQKQLEGTMRNKRIFEQIAAKLQKFGIDRDWKQCRTKYKNLKHEYKIVKNCQDLGTTKSMKFFTELDAILGHTSEQSQKLENKESQRTTKQTNIKMEISNRDNHIPLEDAHDHLKIITVNDAEAGKHWCDNEVRALINIWSDEKIRQMLEGATRNKEIFEEIARRLMKFGIDRDWKQCRTKYKNLKYEYRVLKKKTNHLIDNPKRKMRFYEEIDCILRQQTLGTHSCKNNSSLISESFEGHAMNAESLNKRKAHEDELVPLPLKRSTSDTIGHEFHLTTKQKGSTVHLCGQETKHIQLLQSASQVSFLNFHHMENYQSILNLSDCPIVVNLPIVVYYLSDVNEIHTLKNMASYTILKDINFQNKK
ncbi:uncharacterized protein ACOB8E_004121 [Sarcophilus harrisii]